MSVTLNGTNGLTFNDGSTQNTGATGFGFKNRIINGAMTINQRGFSGSINADSTYTLDRWVARSNPLAKMTIQQSSTAPTGFASSLLVTSSSSYPTLGSTDYFAICQAIEGFNIADLAWGTASAKSVTLSFQVQSSATGTFGGAISNSASNRSYPFTYTISSANTWTTVSVTIPGDTTGTWLTTNGVGMYVYLGLGVGSTFSGTANSWAATAYLSATGSTNVMATNGATFYITGVQLEKGSTATSFDYRPYGTELALCQRYYGKFVGTGSGTQAAMGTGISYTTSAAAICLQFPQTMRSTPTISQSSLAVSDASNYDSNVSSINVAYSNTTNSRLLVNTAATMTQYRTGFLIAQSGTSGYIDFSAEL